MPDRSDFLIVYGTLRPPFDNKFAQYLRRHAQYVGDGTFRGLLFDIGTYPGAVYQKTGQSEVYGTIYNISPCQQQILAYLDVYESIGEQFDQPNEYSREVIPVHYDGRIIDCWAYLYNVSTETKRLIESGDYIQYLNRSEQE